MGQSLLSGVIGGISGAVSGSKFGAPGAIILGTVGGAWVCWNLSCQERA